MPLSRLVKVTGLSLRYCSQIQRGEERPHPRYRRALRTGAADSHSCDQQPSARAAFAAVGAPASRTTPPSACSRIVGRLDQNPASSARIVCGCSPSDAGEPCEGHFPRGESAPGASPKRLSFPQAHRACAKSGAPSRCCLLSRASRSLYRRLLLAWMFRAQPTAAHEQALLGGEDRAQHRARPRDGRRSRCRWMERCPCVGTRPG